MKNRYVDCKSFVLAAFLSGGFASAGADRQTLEEAVPDGVINEEQQFFNLTIENDALGSGHDRNYTSGIRLSYFDAAAIPPEAVDSFSQHIPFFEINESTSVYYTFGQNLYTPKDITVKTPDPDDRPYAAFLYSSVGLTTLSGNHVDDLELTVGVIGPWAQGEETQKFVHEHLDSRDPAGWDHQLENEIGLILAWQRQWPEAFAGSLGDFYFRTSPHIGASIGNVYTYAASGFTLQLTPYETRWQSTPLRVRPAIPGNGFFAVPENRFSWSLFCGVEGRVIGRNIFLDGNTFEDSPSVDKEYFVADANVGLSLTYGRTQVSYTLNWRSKEFKGQSSPSVFGAVSVGYRF